MTSRKSNLTDGSVAGSGKDGGHEVLHLTVKIFEDFGHRAIPEQSLAAKQVVNNSF